MVSNSTAGRGKKLFTSRKRDYHNTRNISGCPLSPIARATTSRAFTRCCPSPPDSGRCVMRIWSGCGRAAHWRGTTAAGGIAHHQRVQGGYDKECRGQASQKPANDGPAEGRVRLASAFESERHG